MAISMKQLLEAGVPSVTKLVAGIKMAEILTERNGIHVDDLQQT